MTKAGDRRGRRGASRLLVVDACVVQSACEKESATPASVACLRALDAILEICHRVVLTDEIVEEWSRHKSGYGRKWFRAMSAKHDKFVFMDAPDWKPSRRALQGLAPGERKAIMKDARLVGPAVKADRIVVTHDAKFMRLMDLHGSDLGLPASIRWIHPENEPDAIEKL